MENSIHHGKAIIQVQQRNITRPTEYQQDAREIEVGCGGGVSGIVFGYY